MMIEPNTHVVGYEYHDQEAYHEVIFHEASRKCVDVYAQRMIEMMDGIQSGTLESAYMRLLLDFSPKGMFPIKYAQDKLLPMLKQSATISKLNLYVAYIANNPADTSLIRSFFMLIRDDNMRRIFMPEERAQAVEWLLSKPDSAT